jgi:hypothetical protein
LALDACEQRGVALSITVREMPAAAASRDMAERNELKSPPHVAASADAAKKRVQNRIAVDRNGVLPSPRRQWASSHGDKRKSSHFLIEQSDVRRCCVAPPAQATH